MIQEIQRQKADQHGYCRDLEAYSFTIDGTRKYAHRYAGERFERPIRTAYKISIHESRRANGVVIKKQFPVTTVGYYDLVEYWVGDCIKSGKVEAIAASLEVSPVALWTLINAKIDPLQERIKSEFAETPEYKTHAEHERVLEAYRAKKTTFTKKYGVDADTYDYCFNVFGEVVNRAYLDQIMKAGKRGGASGSYRETTGGNYDYSKLFGSSGTAYTAEDRGRLKKFYKALAKMYHPDMNRNEDTHAEMVLLNRLKEEWQI